MMRMQACSHEWLSFGHFMSAMEALQYTDSKMHSSFLCPRQALSTSANIVENASLYLNRVATLFLLAREEGESCK